MEFARGEGLGAAAFSAIGPDAIEEIMTLSREVVSRFPGAVFFAGQLLFERETIFSRWLHNHAVFTLQRRFFLAGLPFVILPIRVTAAA